MRAGTDRLKEGCADTWLTHLIIPNPCQESIRKNFILVYELLDEMMDYGYAQATSTESLKNHVYNEPILVEAAKPNIRWVCKQ